MTHPDDRVHPTPITQAAVGGLTKREEFARSAMIGLLSNPEHSDRPYHEIADGAVGFADALIAELNREAS